MKKTILYRGLAVTAAAVMMTSCSSDYLQTEPITDISDSQAVATTQAAQMSIYGIGRIMNTQNDMGRSHTGETSCLYWINEALGPDNNSYFFMTEMGGSWYRWESMDNQDSSLCKSMWDYCYTIISRANTVLSTIDAAEGTDAERSWVKAQALTLRAHGYIHALQWFGYRWQDSNNGEKYGVVLRTESGSAPAPVVGMNDVLKQVYEDLDSAIGLYQQSGKSRKYEFEPDLNIAYGLYARAALIKQDWKTARTMSANARRDYPVIANEEYMSGFIYNTSDYMWTNGDNDIYYSSFGCWFSCNGSYCANWGAGMNANIDFLRQLDPNDIRLKCFFSPDKVDDIAAIPGYEDVASITEADFWNPENVVAGTMDCNWGGLGKMAEGFVKYAVANNPNSGYANTMPYCRVISGVAETTPSVMNLGSPVKMWSVGVNGTYGDSFFPWMRATEFLLTEAEAAYMDGDIASAKSIITELNSIRIPGYVAPDGEALLEDIRLSRRAELWGEGHCWYDFKRWNLPIEERKWVANDPTSGNTPANFARAHAVNDRNGWRLMIPRAESDFNSGFDRTLMGYADND